MSRALQLPLGSKGSPRLRESPVGSTAAAESPAATHRVRGGWGSTMVPPALQLNPPQIFLEGGGREKHRLTKHCQSPPIPTGVPTALEVWASGAQQPEARDAAGLVPPKTSQNPSHYFFVLINPSISVQYTTIRLDRDGEERCYKKRIKVGPNCESGAPELFPKEHPWPAGYLATQRPRTRVSSSCPDLNSCLLHPFCSLRASSSSCCPFQLFPVFLASPVFPHFADYFPS